MHEIAFPVPHSSPSSFPSAGCSDPEPYIQENNAVCLLIGCNNSLRIETLF